MDIAALSVILSQSNVQQAVDTSVMKMAMDTTKEQGTSIEQMASTLSISDPNLGQNVDVSHIRS